MDKRILPAIFSILVISILLINFVPAIKQFDIENTKEFQEANKVNDKISEFAKNDEKAEYLSKEWTNWLRDNSYLNWLYDANPIFKFFLGQEFSLSWAFIASIIIWVGIIFAYYPGLKLVVENQLLALASAAAIGSITTNLLTPKIIEYSGKLAKTATSSIAYLISLIILFVIINKIINEIKKAVKNRKSKVDLKAGNEAKKAVDEFKEVGKGFKEKEGEFENGAGI